MDLDTSGFGFSSCFSSELLAGILSSDIVEFFLEGIGDLLLLSSTDVLKVLRIFFTEIDMSVTCQICTSRPVRLMGYGGLWGFRRIQVNKYWFFINSGCDLWGFIDGPRVIKFPRNPKVVCAVSTWQFLVPFYAVVPLFNINAWKSPSPLIHSC